MDIGMLQLIAVVCLDVGVMAVRAFVVSDR